LPVAGALASTDSVVAGAREFLRAASTQARAAMR